MTDVSIIIVNYHTESLILQCLESVFEKTEGISFEIIVVDNSPGGDMEAMLRESFPGKAGNGIVYIPAETNKGFGAANNIGFSKASGQYLFCLNPDTILVNNAVGILHRYISNHSECGACGGNLYHKDMTRAPSFRRILPGIFWEISESINLHPERLLFGRNTRFNHSRRPIKVGYVSGADLMLRKSLIDRIRGGDFVKISSCISRKPTFAQESEGRDMKSFLCPKPKSYILKARASERGCSTRLNSDFTRAAV